MSSSPPRRRHRARPIETTSPSPASEVERQKILPELEEEDGDDGEYKDGHDPPPPPHESPPPSTTTFPAPPSSTFAQSTSSSWSLSSLFAYVAGNNNNNNNNKKKNKKSLPTWTSVLPIHIAVLALTMMMEEGFLQCTADMSNIVEQSARDAANFIVRHPIDFSSREDFLESRAFWHSEFDKLLREVSRDFKSIVSDPSYTGPCSAWHPVMFFVGDVCAIIALVLVAGFFLYQDTTTSFGANQDSVFWAANVLIAIFVVMGVMNLPVFNLMFLSVGLAQKLTDCTQQLKAMQRVVVSGMYDLDEYNLHAAVWDGTPFGVRDPIFHYTIDARFAKVLFVWLGAASIVMTALIVYLIYRGSVKSLSMWRTAIPSVVCIGVVFPKSSEPNRLWRIGSGCIVSSSRGLVLTNWHLFQKMGVDGDFRQDSRGTSVEESASYSWAGGANGGGGDFVSAAFHGTNGFEKRTSFVSFPSFQQQQLHHHHHQQQQPVVSSSYNNNQWGRTASEEDSSSSVTASSQQETSLTRGISNGSGSFAMGTSNTALHERWRLASAASYVSSPTEENREGADPRTIEQTSPLTFNDPLAVERVRQEMQALRASEEENPTRTTTTTDEFGVPLSSSWTPPLKHRHTVVNASSLQGGGVQFVSPAPARVTLQSINPSARASAAAPTSSKKRHLTNHMRYAEPYQDVYPEMRIFIGTAQRGHPKWEYEATFTGVESPSGEFKPFGLDLLVLKMIARVEFQELVAEEEHGQAHAYTYRFDSVHAEKLTDFKAEALTKCRIGEPSKLKSGDDCLRLLGYPASGGFSLSVLTGYFTSLSYDYAAKRRGEWINVNVSLPSGGSGGAAVNSRGELVGICTQTRGELTNIRGITEARHLIEKSKAVLDEERANRESEERRKAIEARGGKGDACPGATLVHTAASCVAELDAKTTSYIGDLVRKLSTKAA